MNSIDSRLTELFSLFDEFGLDPYIGENVSQLQHAQQAARLAKLDGQPDHVIVGAFLHDIGHLIGSRRGLCQMHHDGVMLGVEDHEGVGEDYLKTEMGFPEEVTRFVKGHVLAKRYLVGRNPDYIMSLSDASKGTLISQGGPMTKQEVDEMEKRSDFEVILKMRHWDDQAKDESMKTESYDELRDLCKKILLKYS